MSLTKLQNSPNPPSAKPINQNRPVLVYEFNRLIDELSDGETFTGPLVVSSDTESTSKDTGAIITEGGIGIEKSLNTGLSITAGTSVTAGTTVSVGTNVLLAKEVNHSILVSTTTTTDTVGGNLAVTSGKGAGTGIGGSLTLNSGQGGATGAGGSISIVSGAGGSTSGNSGSFSLSTGTSTSGVAGDLNISTGTQTSSTVKGTVKISKGLVRIPESSSVASGGTVTAVQLLGGLVTATGATGNWTLPSAANLVTALGGTVTAGTNFEFVFNAAGMTATNTATLVVGAGMSVPSAPAITGGAALTVTQDTQVTAGFRVVFDTTSTCKIYRNW